MFEEEGSRDGRKEPSLCSSSCGRLAMPPSESEPRLVCWVCRLVGRSVGRSLARSLSHAFGRVFALGLRSKAVPVEAKGDWKARD
jgi:hypothetical protein